MTSQDLTADRLRELLAYDPDTGVFTRRVRIGPANVGDVAGSDNGKGYLAIRIDYALYRAHRLAWLYMAGEWPAGQIDHRDGCRSNNRIGNLRDVIGSVNQQNQRRAHSRNKSSGLLGATWDKQRRKWKAHIHVDGKSRHLGYFEAAEQAHAAYLNAKRELHEGCTI